MFRFIFVLLIFIPNAVHAGRGWNIIINNQLDATASENLINHPYASPHAIWGATCWYDKDIGSFDKFAMPSESNRWYTEQEESVFTSCAPGLGSQRLRDFSLYIKENSSSGYRSIAPVLQINSYEDNPPDCGYQENPSDCWDTVYKYHDVKVYEGGGYKTVASFIGNDTHTQTFQLNPVCGVQTTGTFSWVSDKPELSLFLKGRADYQCLKKQATTGSTAAAYSHLSTTTSQPRTTNVALRNGSTKAIKLPQVSANVRWELDECIGNAITSNGLVPRKSGAQIPSLIVIRGLNVGTEECSIQAWAYSSDNDTRIHVATRKYRFSVF